MDDKFIKSKYSIEQLEQFRDENGYIDIGQTDISLENSENDPSREKIGNTDRFKNWTDFQGTKALLKEEIKLEGKRNFGIYSELIMEELAKQMGLEAARTDLIKYHEKYGILSEMVVDLDKEEMDTIYAVVGDTSLDEENPDVCDFKEVEDKFIEYLKKLDMTTEEINAVVNERRKQHILRLFCGEADGHLENESIIRYKTEDGRIVAKMAPMFDNETSFLLDMNEETLNKALELNDEYNKDKEQLEKFLDKSKKGETRAQINEWIENNFEFQATIYNLRNMKEDEQGIAEILEGNKNLRVSSKGRGKTVFIPNEDEIEDYPYDSVSDNTLAFIRDFEEPEIDDFLGKVYDELDVNIAIDAVEKKIGAPIPQIVKKVIVPFIEMRKKILDNILCVEEPCASRLEDAHIINKNFKININTKNNYSEEIGKRSVNQSISMEEAMRFLMNLATPTKTKDNQAYDEILDLDEEEIIDLSDD